MSLKNKRLCECQNQHYGGKLLVFGKLILIPIVSAHCGYFNVSRLDNNSDKDLAIFKVVLPTLGHIDIMLKIVRNILCWSLIASGCDLKTSEPLETLK